MPPIPDDILPQAPHPHFMLNSSGLAGFFGGDEAISAMNTSQFYEGRKFMGLYNSPGGYRMAKHYGRLAKSRIWRGFYPDVYLEPHEVFSLDGGPGKMVPDFLGAQTGVIMERIGHLGYLFFKQMRDMSTFEDVYSSRDATKPAKITIVNLGQVTLPEKRDPNQLVPSIPLSISNHRVLLLNIIPVMFSIGASIVCGLSADWYACSLIILGIVAHGLACFVLGSGRIRVDFVTPPKKSPRGDGLMTMEGHMVIVLGEEKEVFQVTRASISIEFPPWVKLDHYIGACCLLLMMQLLVQIFLIPQATLFGQILFLASFGVSWLFNTYMSAIDKEDLQREFLGKSVWNVDRTSIKAYQFRNWTTMAISVLFILNPPKGIAEELLDRLLPNKTLEWKEFKQKVIDAYLGPGSFLATPPEPPANAQIVVENMYSDWRDAVEFYKKHKIESKCIGGDKASLQSDMEDKH